MQYRKWKHQRIRRKAYVSLWAMLFGVIIAGLCYYSNVFSWLSWTPSTGYTEPYGAILEKDDPEFVVPKDAIEQNQYKVTNTHKVLEHQSLSDIFQLYGLDPNDLLGVIKANAQATHLSVGQVVEWEQNQRGGLLSLTIYRNARLNSRYVRIDNKFEFTPKRVQGDRKTQIKRAEVRQSFYQAARSIGLSLDQIQAIANALYWQVDVTKQARLGDKLAVQLSLYYVGQETIDTGEISAIWYQHNNKNYQVIRASDGNFYHLDGSSIEKPLDRFPLKSDFRISSKFNPHRLNPVSYRYAPHYGTDFATPMNTPVYATGDGIVVKVGMHPLAGHYLVIKNGRTYSTRFLHLNKVLVDVGQVVSRGQKVAFSGNSGRSTGPHLHYELRKNGQPIDAMSAPLPDANGIPSEQKVAFLSLAHKVIREIRDRF